MAIENGDFVKIEFTGKVVETGEIFDTTSEEVAKESDIFDERKQYIPLPIIIGGGHLLDGLDNGIIGLNEGESKIVTLSPEEGYGVRNKELLQIFTLKDFKKQGMNPYPGMQFQLDGHTGRVLTINGGRVRVDFNHPLAGKTLEFSVVVNKVLDNDEDKIKSLVQLHYSYPNLDIEKTKLSFEDKTVFIELDEITKFDQQRTYMDVTLIRFRIAKDIYENLDYDSVKFVDTFDKPADEEDSATVVDTDLDGLSDELNDSSKDEKVSDEKLEEAIEDSEE
ncbi:MAG: peptidylprolyl isomerase [Methanobrevibacter sp.]|jgi:peptidylprolyl isomerase/FKBP-type peptidyl-prolyl cis-trans isomerase SlyD|nr:peptidylprolyl isomerase [Candidatus Methanoflexus mossambicus]